MNKYGFSKRELQVIRLLMQGKSNKQIALILGISEGTVESHLTSIYSKLGVDSRVPAILAIGQSGLSLDAHDQENMGKTPGEKTGNHGKTPGDVVTGKGYDGYGQPFSAKDGEMIGRKNSPIRNKTIPGILAITITLIAALVLYEVLSRPKSWKGYERECEYPEKSTTGQTIGRSNASGNQVHGQFGVMLVEPWSAKPGDAVYENISTPRVEQLYLKLRYSKNSSPSGSILVSLDDEKIPRASIYPENQKDWNRFAWTDQIFLGSVESGVHTITFSTAGQQYGVADLDKFSLTAGPP
jgi:DNA-binding CsgD family transcriptional regulator